MHDATLIFLYHMYLNNSGNQPGYHEAKVTQLTWD